MASLVEGYACDIFISYRHNDNRSGWVSDFVQALKVELATTLKDPVSVYYDTNPYDGLLEMHNVDRSLEAKLKGLIFIPILSQTYCDPKSFAWQHEFCAFNRLAMNSELGRDIVLYNGNVASRILPIRIHDLDAEDMEIIETEIGGVLRSIDFVYKTPGVNRPLQPDDLLSKNESRAVYKDQMNKLANAIKVLIQGIRFPEKVTVSPKPTAASGKDEEKKSIAVLPFVNLSHDPKQEYFTDGITENILLQLASLRKLRVISRTSIMRYKGSTQPAPEIASELNVQYLLEGSAMMQGDKVRIQVQLIDAMRDEPIWSKAFVEKLDDIFEVQSDVAEVVANELKSSLDPGESKKLKEKPTKNLEAYDLYLKGRHAFNQWGLAGYQAATEFFRQAVEKDPHFQLAHSYLASSYSARMSWNGDLSPTIAKQLITESLEHAWALGPTDNDYVTKAFVAFFVEKNFEDARDLLLKAIDLNPNNALSQFTLCYVLHMMGRPEDAWHWYESAKVIEPLSIASFNFLVINHYLNGRFEESLNALQEAFRLHPSVIRLYDFQARVLLTMGRHEDVLEAVEAGLAISRLRPPSMLAYQSMAYHALNKHEKAQKLKDELTRRSQAGEKGTCLYLMYMAVGAGHMDEAAKWYIKAADANDVDLIWWNVDPLLTEVREEIVRRADDHSNHYFKEIEQHILEMLREKMPPRPYHNVDHILDVLNASMLIGEHEGISGSDLALLRLAALLHDAGFIDSPQRHEQRSSEIALEILPRFSLNPDQINQICQMILATKIPQSPSSQLDRILCDADLDYLGREDFYEIGNKLQQELEQQGVVQTEREWNILQKAFLEAHRYHTSYANANRQPAKLQRLREVTARLQRNE